MLKNIQMHRKNKWPLPDHWIKAKSLVHQEIPDHIYQVLKIDRLVYKALHVRVKGQNLGSGGENGMSEFSQSNNGPLLHGQTIDATNSLQNTRDLELNEMLRHSVNESNEELRAADILSSKRSEL